MLARTIVKSHDIAEDFSTGLRVIGKNIISTFAFQSRPEALHRSVIEAIALTTHTHKHASVAEPLLVGMAGILATAIGMVHQAAWWMMQKDCHIEGIQCQLSS